MDTRKYSSPLGRDIGTSKATKGRGWKGLKGQMALSLAVSLWIGNGVTLWVPTAAATTLDNGVEVTLDSNNNVTGINLQNWDSTKGAYEFSSGWKGANVPVNTGSFFNAPNETTTILTANTANFFGTVTGNKAYTIDSHTPFTRNGITMSHYGVSGVKAEAYNGLANAKLTYYTPTNIATLVTIGGIEWNTSAPAWSNAKYTFNADTVIDASNLTFNGTAYTALKTDGTSKMTLLSGVTGGENVLLTNITQPSEGKGTLAVNYTNNQNIDFTATASGEVSVGTDKVDYTINNVTLSDVNLANWNGTTSEVPTGWTANADGISVTGGGFTAPSITTGNSVDILTTGTNGFFSNANISDAIKFKDYGEVSDTDKGVTLIGNESKGVKANTDGKNLIYERDFTVDNITLGEIAWNAGGTVFNGTGYDFNTNTVSWGLDNIKNLTFTFANEAAYKSLAPNATMTLISNATGIHGASAGPNPTFDYKVANGAALNTKVWGQLYVGGDPSPSYEDTLTYKIDYVDIESVNLADWDSTKAAFSVPDGWIKKNLGHESVPVTAAGFTAPTLTAGQSKDIITTNTTNFFSDDKITGALKYAVQAASTDTANGVALTGSESKGVKASTDGKNLVYARSNFEVSGISLGTITWNKGGTARELTAGDYTFNDSTAIDTSSFEFNTPSYIGAGESMTLIGNATGLTAGDNIAHSQSYTNYDNCIKLNATLTGNITRTTNTLGYTATGTTLDSVDLANWNGTTTAVPAAWDSNLGANSIKAAGFAAPDVAAGESTNILTTTTNNFFNDNQITGAMKYKADAASSDTTNGVTLTGAESKGVKASDDGKNLVYARSNFEVSGISLGNMMWGTAREATTSYDFNHVADANISTANLKFSNPESIAKDATTTLLSGATNLNEGTDIAHTQDFTKTVNGATLSATLSGNVTRATAGQIGYTATGTALNSINLTGWNGTTAAVPTGWNSALGANSITATSFTGSTAVAPGTEQNILITTTDNFFNDNQITNALKYKEYAASSKTLSGVTLTGSESKGVKASTDGKNLVYARSNKNVSNISFGTMKWGMSLTANDGYDYKNANIDLSKLTFSNPETISAGGTTTLLVANNTLKAIGETVKNVSYEYSPVAGATVNGTVNGSYMTTNVPALQYTATENKADKLTFGNVEWKDTGALMTRPNNITFAGADVDTTNINFTNIKELEANKNMTLVSNFGDTVGTITGTKYKVGSTLQGEGKASLEGNNLIFTTDTRAEKMTVQEQTHNTVMGAEVGMAALSAGNDFVGAATEGLAMAGNTGTDGMATYANMGGGSMNVETGSHVKTHTWNAILALGHKNEKKLSTTEYGAFFEYGTGNYSTFNGDERGDGSTRYTGGGILGKWQKNNGFYVEGSLRAGSIHDDANNVLRDANGNPYSYTTDATYWGAHIGVGREIKLNKTAVLDLYAKYFYNHRGSVSFDAGGHYDLGAVESSVLRVGTRYTVKQNDNIHYYGGLAVEHEFCGRASGFADGVAIRGADISGTSVRGEIGATFRPGDKSNVTLDLYLSGFVGKKQALTGGLSAVFHI